MLTDSRPVAILPARGGSKRLPRKNILPLAGQPMLAWPVLACRQSGLFARILVSTDDPEIAEVARAQGAESVERPPELAGDEAHESKAYQHVLSQIREETGRLPDYFCAIYPTAAFVRPADLVDAFAQAQLADADVVMAVSTFPLHPYKALLPGKDGYLKMGFPDSCLARSQTYPRFVASVGAFYWFRTQAFLREPSYYPERLVGYELPEERCLDLDTESDYARAQVLARIYLNAEQPA